MAGNQIHTCFSIILSTTDLSWSHEELKKRFHGNKLIFQKLYFKFVSVDTDTTWLSNVYDLAQWP